MIKVAYHIISSKTWKLEFCVLSSTFTKNICHELYMSTTITSIITLAYANDIIL